MHRYNTRDTIYSDYVREQLQNIARGGGSIFSFPALASHLGLKPTHNLRKRLRTLERDGILSIGYAPTGQRGMMYIYTVHASPEVEYAFVQPEW